MWNLCSGNTWAKPSAFSMASADCADLVMLRVAQSAGIQNVRAHPQLPGSFLSDGQLIACNHLDVYAHLPGAGDGGFGLLARRIEQGQHAHKLPLAFLIRPGDAQGTEAATGKFIDRFLHGGLYLTGVRRHLQNHLRRSLGHKELFPVSSLDGGFRALVHRVEGLEMEYLIALQRFIVLHAANHRQVNGVLVFRARSERAVEDGLVRGNTVHGEGIAQGQLVLGQGAGLVRAQHVHARQFLDRRQPRHDGFFFRQQTRADRHGYGEHRGHRHRNRGHQKHQAEFQSGENLVATDERDDNITATRATARIIR